VAEGSISISADARGSGAICPVVCGTAVVGIVACALSTGVRLELQTVFEEKRDSSDLPRCRSLIRCHVFGVSIGAKVQLKGASAEDHCQGSESSVICMTVGHTLPQAPIKLLLGDLPAVLSRPSMELPALCLMTSL
jgi:hypothetical protein